MLQQSPVQRRNADLFHMGSHDGALYGDCLPLTFFSAEILVNEVSPAVVHVVHLIVSK